MVLCKLDSVFDFFIHAFQGEMLCVCVCACTYSGEEGPQRMHSHFPQPLPPGVFSLPLFLPGSEVPSSAPVTCVLSLGSSADSLLSRLSSSTSVTFQVNFACLWKNSIIPLQYQYIAGKLVVDLNTFKRLLARIVLSNRNFWDRRNIQNLHCSFC